MNYRFDTTSRIFFQLDKLIPVFIWKNQTIFQGSWENFVKKKKKKKKKQKAVPHQQSTWLCIRNNQKTVAVAGEAAMRSVQCGKRPVSVWWRGPCTHWEILHSLLSVSEINVLAIWGGNVIGLAQPYPQIKITDGLKIDQEEGNKTTTSRKC